MRLITILLLCSFVAFGVYKAISALITRSRHAATAKRLGCQPPPAEYHPDSLGIVNTIKVLRAYNRSRILEYFRGTFDLVSERANKTVLTYDTWTLGDRVIWTCDPKNIQAMLATQFGDFELGQVRTGAFAPL